MHHVEHRKQAEDTELARRKLRRIRVHVAVELNSYVAVNQLPDDILALVFEHHDRDALYFREYNERKDQWPIHPTITVSSVCARWRAVALAHPVLWSRIDLNASRPHPGFLVERAKCHPLLLMYQHFFGGWAEGWEEHAFKLATASFLEDNFSRVRSLDINGFTYDEHLVNTLVNTQAPLLEELCLAGLSFFSPVFGGHAPRVRRLGLRSVEITWSPGLFANLSSLTVSDIGNRFEPGTGICGILRSSPHLESLCLKKRDHRQHAFIAHEHQQPCTPRMALARLHTLTLDLPINLIHHILSSFELPSLHNADLTPHAIVIEDDDRLRPPLLPLLPSLCAPDMLPRALFAPLAAVHATALEEPAASRPFPMPRRRPRRRTAHAPARWRGPSAAAILRACTTSRPPLRRASCGILPRLARRAHALAALLRAPALRTLTPEGRAEERSVLATAFVETGVASVCALCLPGVRCRAGGWNGWCLRTSSLCRRGTLSKESWTSCEASCRALTCLEQLRPEDLI
ncbi:hypothetical protein PsYK624_050940 [Phanerochaete sordida]|uniref:F-box domain-containing protein n=1 Tax=Phanerochaete sordida TaxID=48140 RepID=A0A9P3LB98_9APHY|nr:hypothetical protein PsYK624_050940 [Phanerochaete sordida]